MSLDEKINLEICRWALENVRYDFGIDQELSSISETPGHPSGK